MDTDQAKPYYSNLFMKINRLPGAPSGAPAQKYAEKQRFFRKNASTFRIGAGDFSDGFALIICGKAKPRFYVGPEIPPLLPGFYDTFYDCLYDRYVFWPFLFRKDKTLDFPSLSHDLRTPCIRAACR